MFLTLTSLSQTTFSGNITGGFLGSNEPEFFFNDFSDSIFGGWAKIDRSSSRKTIPRINNGVLKIEINPGDYSTYSNKAERFELEKRVSPSLGVKNKFMFRSKNIITDRVNISQIKLMKRNSNGTGPIAAIYLDRPPQCSTWESKDMKNYMRKGRINTNNYNHLKKLKGLDNKYYLVTKKGDDGMYEYHWRPSDLYEKGIMNHNLSYKKLNDGKWHQVEMIVYPHKTKGICKIIIDGEIIFDIKNANTFTYLPSRSTHGGFAARIGVYRDSVSYSQSVEFDNWSVSTFDMP